jgi:hypothetical protein
MGVSAKVGSFNIDTTKTVGQTQTITGVGFTPKLVMFWWAGGTNTSDVQTDAGFSHGFGAATGSTERWMVAVDAIDASSNGVDSYAHGGMSSGSQCIAIRTGNKTTGFAVDGIMDFDSFNSDGFVLMIDDQFASSYRIHYLAIGGTDITSVKAGRVDTSFSTPYDLNLKDVTDIGFTPDAMIVSRVQSSQSSSIWGRMEMSFLVSPDNVQHVGAWLGNGYGWGAATFCQSGYLQNEISLAQVGTTNTYELLSPARIQKKISNGIKISCSGAMKSLYPYWYFGYVAIKGGTFAVGNLTTRTDGNDIAITTGFQPKAIMFCSVNSALSTDEVVDSGWYKFSMGAGTSTSERAASCQASQQALGSACCFGDYDSAVYGDVYSDAIQGLMDIKSIDASGFTCVMDDTDPAGKWVMYMAFGEGNVDGTPNGSDTFTRPDYSPWDGGKWTIG